MIQKEVQKAIEDERESMFQALEQKMNDEIERRDRFSLLLGGKKELSKKMAGIYTYCYATRVSGEFQRNF